MPISYFLPPIETGDTPGPPAQDETRALGRDIRWNGSDVDVTADGDYVLVEGASALRQAVYNCMITIPGDYKLRPGYGVGLGDYVGKLLTTANKEEIKELIRRNLLQMKRIQEVFQIVVENGSDSNSLFVHLTIRAAGRVVKFAPFEFRSS